MNPFGYPDIHAWLIRIKWSFEVRLSSSTVWPVHQRMDEGRSRTPSRRKVPVDMMHREMSLKSELSRSAHTHTHTYTRNQWNLCRGDWSWQSNLHRSFIRMKAGARITWHVKSRWSNSMPGKSSCGRQISSRFHFAWHSIMKMAKSWRIATKICFDL
jgi:hypothetical protein